MLTGWIGANIALYIPLVQGRKMKDHSATRSLMEQKVGSLERTQGDHELQHLVCLLSDVDLTTACHLINEFEAEEISCETLDFELDIIFDKYRELKISHEPLAA